MVKKDSRIWEIDALRGLCIPGMIAIHLIYDVVNLYGFVHWPYPAWYSLFKNNYGALFILISGLSVTLGSRSVKRGLTVFAGGMVVTAVTVGMYLLGFAGKGIVIYFGVLHCLGVCMMLWPAFQKRSQARLIAVGLGMTVLGWWLRTVSFDVPALLLPLGLRYPGFSSSDYFPLMPNLGYFLLGAAFGRKFYGSRQTLLRRANAQNPLIRGLCWCGRHSLMIYLLHQPVLAAGCEIYAIVSKGV